VGWCEPLVGTMLQVGRNKISVEEFRSIIDARDCSRADFSAAAHGLFLVEVKYPENFFPLKSSSDRYF
jgi:tRNA pseudouridine38-40 synthase